MARIKDEIYVGVGSGLNTDDDPRFFPMGDTDWRLNAVPFGDGTQGLVTNMKGTEAITHAFTHDTSTYPNATYTIIGGCYDEKRNAYYYFIYSSLSNHCIIRYNIDDEDFDRIVWDSLYIGLDLNYPITDAFVLDNYLCWNPRSSSPRMLNIGWCTNYYDYDTIDDPETYDSGDFFKYNGKVFECLVDSTSGTDAQADIDNNEYVLVRWTGEFFSSPNYNYFYNNVQQPTVSPNAVYANDTTINYNNLKQRVFQFAYRYILGDGRESVYSPYSDVVGQKEGQGAYGDLTTGIQVENKLNVNVYFDYSANGYDIVKNIDCVEVVFREASDSGWGTWKLAGRLKWGDNIAYVATLAFYNDKNYDVVDQDEVAVQYDALPVTANAQSPIIKNRVAYAGITEGYDTIVPDVDITVNFSEQSVSLEGGTPVAYTVNETIVPVDYDGDGVNDFNEYYYNIVIPSTVTVGYSVEVTLDDNKASLVVTAGTLNDYRAAIRNLIIRNQVNAQISATGVEINAGSKKMTVTCSVYPSPAAAFTTMKGLKTGASHKLCMFYYDGLMRRSGAVVSDDMEKYLPFITEQVALGNITTAGAIYKYYLTYAINHLPPTWARYWRFGYAGNTSISKFWQYTVKSVANSAEATAGTRVYNNDSNQYPEYEAYTEISIDPLQLHKVGDGAVFTYVFPNSNIDLYEFQAGDRVRFIMNSVGTGAVVPLSGYYDYEIKAYDASGDEACIFVENIASPAIDAYGLVEIYRPKKETEEVVYYEVGELNAIYDSSGTLYHRATGTNQSSGVAATGVIDVGDIYHLSRIFSYHVAASAIAYPVESEAYSDFYDSSVWGTGKIGTIDNIGQTTSNALRYSNTYLEGTKINGLSRFELLSGYEDVTSLHGSVKAIAVSGNVLKFITDAAVISAGMGVQEYADATGSSNVVTSDRVIGYQRVSRERYGTTHPESVCNIDGVIYFWDFKNGCVVRDAGNGLFPISGNYPTQTGGTDHKMRTFFRQMRDAMITNGYSTYRVWMAYERNYDLLYIYFNDTSDQTNNVLLGFHLSTGRWFSRYTWSNGSSVWPFHIGGGGRFFTSTIGENTYKHFSSTANRCTFYGSAKAFELRVYTAQGNSEVKVYDRFAVQANTKPAVNDVTVITLEDSNGYMKSIIPSSYLERIENGWFAPFLRNMGSVSTTNLITSWSNGALPFSTFTTSGTDITQAQVIFDDAYGQTNTIALNKDKAYKFTCTAASSENNPRLYYGMSYATKVLLGTLLDGANTFAFRPTFSGISYLYIASDERTINSSLSSVSLLEDTGNVNRNLISGDLLRGNSLRLDLDYATATSEITVYKVVIGSELSNV